MGNLKAGMYEIAEDVTNPKPDRRKAARSFSAHTVWTKGMRVCVEEDGDCSGHFRIYRSGGYPHLGVAGRFGGKHNHPGFEALAAALRPIEWTDAEWVSENIISAGSVLVRLLKDGKVTREDLLKTEAEVL